MKKFIISVLTAISLSGVHAESKNIHNHSHYEYYKTDSKGNISPESLPKTITQYLKKNYPDCEIMVSKKKKNGNYFIKIRYRTGHSHSYYRSLVFDAAGKTIKG